MLSIHESIDYSWGCSTYLFDKKKLMEYEHKKAGDLLLLFMPDLDFNCPLNYLLACESFEILKRLVELIDSYFTKFIEEESSINKLKDMFKFIYKESCSYTKEIIELRYCSVPMDNVYIDSEDEETEKITTYKKYNSKIKEYFLQINEKILADVQFSKIFRAERFIYKMKKLSIRNNLVNKNNPNGSGEKIDFKAY